MWTGGVNQPLYPSTGASDVRFERDGASSHAGYSEGGKTQPSVSAMTPRRSLAALGGSILSGPTISSLGSNACEVGGGRLSLTRSTRLIATRWN